MTETLDSPLLWTNFIFWICNTALIVWIGLRSFELVKEAGEDIDDSQKRSLQTWGYFFLILAISNVLILTWRFIVTDVYFINSLESTANALFYIACFIKVLTIERSLIESKWYQRFYFSFIICITIFINLIVPPSFLKIISPFQILFIVIITVGYSVFPISYFYVSRKSSGKVARSALKVSAGAIFLALGYLMGPSNLEAYRLTPFLNMVIDIFYISAPIAIVIGTLLIYDSFRKIE